MKGKMVSQFHVGQHVSFPIGDNGTETGRICKLHMSGTFGVAEIHRDNGERKIARKLQYVQPVHDRRK